MAKVMVNEVIGKAKLNVFFIEILFVLIITVIFDGYDASIFGALNPILISDLNFTPAQAGFLASWGTVGMLAGSFFLGILGDMIGKKRTIMLSVFIFCFFTGLCGFSRGYADFAVFRFIAGVGLSGIMPNVGSMLSEYSPEKQRSTVITLSVLGMPLGSILASLIVISMIDLYGWRVVFYTSFILLLLLVIQHFALPETMIVHVKKGDKTKIASILKKADPEFAPSAEDDYYLPKVDTEAAKLPVFSIFRHGFAMNTILFSIMMFCNFFVIYGVTFWLPKLMMELGNSYNLSLWFNLIFYVGAILGILAGGWHAGKFGLRKAMPVYFLIAAAAIAALWVKAPVVLTVLLLLVAGGGVNGVQGMMSALIAQSYPLSVRSTAFGTLFTVGRLGSIVGPVVLGMLLTAGEPSQISFLIIAVPLLVNMVLIRFIKDYVKVIR